ncbi:MAG: cupin domain-containing protein [Janthinobacterium lividum]
MAQFTLRLIEDVLPANQAPIYLPAAERALYMVEGAATIEFETGAQHVTAEGTWLGGGALGLLAGAEGARIWRWELLPPADATPGLIRSAPGVKSVGKLEETIELDARQSWLMRCDKVEFPPGGIAHTHVHQGPGIRCCLRGEITIETLGQTHVHQPGDAWLELGYEPVLAPTTELEETVFIRCFVLPRASRGRSSIRYVKPEDASKQKPQRYHVFGERFIELA